MAPPGVDCWPEMAMRSGHRAAAFFMPAWAMASISASWMAVSVQSWMPASTGRKRFSAARDTSGLVLLFLLVYSATS